jgi:hypothetical protein
MLSVRVKSKKITWGGSWSPNFASAGWSGQVCVQFATSSVGAEGLVGTGGETEAVAEEARNGDWVWVRG